VKIGRGVRQECCLSPILFNLYSEYLIKEALEGFRDFKPGQVIRTVKHTDDPILLAKEEDMLQGLIKKLIEMGRCYGMEINM
jgi:Reverse transcriptase (RNA-dependent DNA polymerase).